MLMPQTPEFIKIKSFGREQISRVEIPVPTIPQRRALTDFAPASPEPATARPLNVEASTPAPAILNSFRLSELTESDSNSLPVCSLYRLHY